MSIREKLESIYTEAKCAKADMDDTEKEKVASKGEQYVAQALDAAKEAAMNDGDKEAAQEIDGIAKNLKKGKAPAKTTKDTDDSTK